MGDFISGKLGVLIRKKERVDFDIAVRDTFSIATAICPNSERKGRGFRPSAKKTQTPETQPLVKPEPLRKKKQPPETALLAVEASSSQNIQKPLKPYSELTKTQRTAGPES